MNVSVCMGSYCLSALEVITESVVCEWTAQCLVSQTCRKNPYRQWALSHAELLIPYSEITQESVPEQTWQNSHWIACRRFMNEAEGIILVISLQDSCIHTLSIQNVNTEEVRQIPYFMSQCILSKVSCQTGLVIVKKEPTFYACLLSGFLFCLVRILCKKKRLVCFVGVFLKYIGLRRVCTQVFSKFK